MTCRFVTPNQETLYFHVTSRVERDAQGTPMRLVGSAQDVSSRLRRRQTLLHSQRRLRAAFDGAPLAVVVASLNGRVTWLNERAMQLLGPAKALPGCAVTTLIPGEDTWFASTVDDLMSGDGDRITLERRLHGNGGTAVRTRIHVSLARTSEGGSGHVVLVLDDESVEQRAREQEQRGCLPHGTATITDARTPRIDALTGLPNRQALEVHLQAVACKAMQNSQNLSLILLGFDRFNAVNEILGVAQADQLLREAGARLAEALDDSHFVARYGGARFAVLAPPDTARERLAGLARFCVDLLQCERTSSTGNRITVTVSAGMSMLTADQADRTSLINQAESALILQGPLEQATLRFFSAEVAAALTRRLTIESGLLQASIKDEFEIYLQPKWCLATGRITGAEALLRWQSKSLGTICPTEFIAVAEQHSVILDIGRWVIRRVVEHLARVKLRHPDFQVSINLSARQLDDVDLPGFISRTVAKAGLSPRSLQFELTETWLIRNAGAAKSFLARLKELGFTIALDDFGVGYSSLAYLAQFPVDVVKLDRSFVERLPESETACVVAASVLDLSRRLRMQTIAEGVETEAQRDFLQAAGCDQAQGWLVAPALPADQFFVRFEGSALPVPIGKEFVLNQVESARGAAFRV